MYHKIDTSRMVGLPMREYSKLVGRSYVTVQTWRSKGKIKGKIENGLMMITEGVEGEHYGMGGVRIEMVAVGKGEKVEKVSEDGMVVKIKAEMMWLLGERGVGYTEKIKDLAGALAQLMRVENGLGNPDDDLKNMSNEELEKKLEG